MAENVFDTIIVGTGPAGLSAALNLKKYNKNFVWFGSWNLSDKVRKAEEITNYPGFVSVTGEELYDKFTEQAKANQLEITEKTVTNIMKNGETFMVLADNQVYTSKTLILAMGVMSAKTLPGEDEYLGRGVSYCATCDGMFYKGKTIAVVTNDKKYEHEVKYLADLANKVYYFPLFKESEFERSPIDKLELMTGNVKEIGCKKNDGMSEVTGELSASSVVSPFGARVTQVTLSDDTVLQVDGVFLLRNAIAPSKLMPGLELENAHIVVDRNCSTSIPGCFAAGDCTGRPYQYTKAVGEGNIAAHSVIEYLSNI